MTNTSKVWRNVPPPMGGEPKSNVYARFIPREELSSFEAWKLGEFDAGATQQPAAVAEPPAPPKRDAAELLAEQLQQARQSGYQDGYRDGLVALDGFKQSFVQQASLQVGALVQSIGSQLDGLQQDMAQSLAVTAIHLARQIVRSELTGRPEAVVRVAQEAVDALILSARHVTLRVHPDDHALIAEGAAEVIEARGARVVDDASVTRGGCIVESNIGLIDATLESRWRRVVASLGSDEDWHADAPGSAP
ncbi:FliH/SctL family protein [Piscinibacter koreensis]|uniref:Flagellar assembly protein FliH n=1 Tax=Piscinibacter koreensis TaxID=2742824 RepID=A0A7Y6NML5_9BURK|nr:FliH/SctL family protein [Schlegelella koreensis]NUZ05937.1 flagellar assembly protein FliH [Schlegelella koreensis]